MLAPLPSAVAKLNVRSLLGDNPRMDLPPFEQRDIGEPGGDDPVRAFEKYSLLQFQFELNALSALNFDWNKDCSLIDSDLRLLQKLGLAATHPCFVEIARSISGQNLPLTSANMTIMQEGDGSDH